MSKTDIFSKIEQLDAIFTKNINSVNKIVNGKVKKQSKIIKK